MVPVVRQEAVGRPVGDLGVEVKQSGVVGFDPSTPASNDLSRPNPGGFQNGEQNASGLGPPPRTVPRTDSGEASCERHDERKQTWLLRGPLACAVGVISLHRVRK